MLNPGKLASADDSQPLTKLDGATFRGQFDRTIPAAFQREFAGAIACNGNSICHTWEKADTMCPSYKVTRDRSQSPQGRSTLLRRWARAQGISRFGGWARNSRRRAERDTFAALDTCLSCKACATQCPARVDIPTMKSRFLSRYYSHRFRPLRHWIIRHMESMLPFARRFPLISDIVLGCRLSRFILKTLFGLVDLPAISPAIAHDVSSGEHRPSVILVEDTFTSSFDGVTVNAATALLTLLGYRVKQSKPKANGKALHVVGLRRGFQKIARARWRERLAEAESGAPLIGLDAATALMYENEYREFCDGPAVQVTGIEEFLARELRAGHLAGEPGPADREPVQILLHCTEKAQRPLAGAHWQQIFGHFGLRAEVALTGCCGMAGLFGHEVEHVKMSRDIFDLSWQSVVSGNRGQALVTGFSCRCQTERFSGFRPRHPVEYLLEYLRSPPVQESRNGL
jgi:Fe-S oxidoreductase